MEGHKKICVLGSANSDHFLYVNKIPAVGETIQSHRYFTANGGKGANQAVSVGKLAGSSYFLGQVGNDDARTRLEIEMKAANVDLQWKVLEGRYTGMAYIYVDAQGENSIVIYGGTNMEFDNLQDIDQAFKKVIDASDYLLLQKEVPMEINLAAAKYAHSQSKVVILDCGGRDDPISD
jgi:ribokinase